MQGVNPILEKLKKLIGTCKSSNEQLLKEKRVIIKI